MLNFFASLSALGTYTSLFFLNFIEGTAVVLAFSAIASHGFLNPFLVGVVVVVSDICGDIFYYSVGRSGNTLFARFKPEEHRLLKVRDAMRTHPAKLLFLSKVTYSVGFLIQIAAGATRLPFWYFLFFNVIGTTVKTSVLVSIGYFFGSTFLAIDSNIGKVMIGAVFVALCSVVIFYIRKKAHN